MTSPDRIAEVVRKCFECYMTVDRAAIEALLTDDFTFTSPYDDHIDRATYFERCWPNAGTFEYHELKTILVEGDQCFVLYEGKSKRGNLFRNTEHMRIEGDRIRSVEVFFGLPRGQAPRDPGSK
jgi:ketosteroid isomerase-like protein